MTKPNRQKQIVITLTVELHPTTPGVADVVRVLPKLLRKNLSIGKPGWFTFESDEEKGVPGVLFCVTKAKVGL